MRISDVEGFDQRYSTVHGNVSDQIFIDSCTATIDLISSDIPSGYEDADHLRWINPTVGIIADTLTWVVNQIVGCIRYGLTDQTDL